MMEIVVEKTVKMTRIKVACLPCKMDKSRCDAGRPCTRCTVKGKIHLCIDRPTSEIPDDEHVAVQTKIVNQKRPYKKRKSTIEEFERDFKKQKLSGDSKEDFGVQVIPSGSDLFKNMFSFLLKPFFQTFAVYSSPFWLKDFITERTDIWRRFLTRMWTLFPREEVLKMRELMVKSAASVVGDSSAQFSNLSWFEIEGVTQFKTEKFDLPSDAIEVIQKVFKLNSLDNSDLGVLFVKHKVGDHGKLDVTRYLNKNMELIIGRSIESFGDPLESDGTPKTPFLVQVLTTDSLQKLFKYIHPSSVQTELPRFAESIEIIQPDNSLVNCFLLCILNLNSQNEQKETYQLVVLKPRSITFDPEGFSQIAKVELQGN
jgi:hypothetical protein